VCCSVLQCVAVCCSVLQCVAVCCSVMQCVAVWCSVLQCVALATHCTPYPLHTVTHYTLPRCVKVSTSSPPPPVATSRTRAVTDFTCAITAAVFEKTIAKSAARRLLFLSVRAYFSTCVWFAKVSWTVFLCRNLRNELTCFWNILKYTKMFWNILI